MCAVAAMNTVPAERLADHRLAYLDYEGPVSGDRGHVRRLDAGTFAVRQDSSNVWEVELSGAVVSGILSLERDAPDASQWRLTLQPSRGG